jgi:hypothetical protein
MPAKKNKKQPDFDIQRDFNAHLDASRQAHTWAEKSIALRTAGKATAADAAERKAKHWLRKMIGLEARATHGKPTGART